MDSSIGRLKWVLAAVLVLLPGSAFAQNAGAFSLQIDPSIRAAGMGRASTSVFWDLDPNDWSNPALLGYRRGIQFEHGHTQLVPDLASDVFFDSDRLTLGAYGVGVVLAGKPISGLGRTHLDYGMSEATTEQGEVIGTFHSWEDADAEGIGISLSSLAETVAGARRVSAWTRFGDVSLGIVKKSVDVELAPAWATGSGQAARAKADLYDDGLLLRLTPYNSLDGLGWSSRLDSMLGPYIGGFRLDVSRGWSALNRTEQRLNYGVMGQSDPLPHVARRGVAVHVAVGLPAALRDALKAQHLGIVARSLTPLVGWGKAWDREADRVNPAWGEIKLDGWELTLANVFTLRRGFINDRTGDIIDGTSGWGLGFHIGSSFAFRYDSATIPQAAPLVRVHRRGWMAMIDPLSIWSDLAR